MPATLRWAEDFGSVGKNLEAEPQVADLGEADKPGTELGEETGPSRNEDGAVSRPETREVSQREIGTIWGFSKV